MKLFRFIKNVDWFSNKTLRWVGWKGMKVLQWLCLELFSWVKLNKNDSTGNIVSKMFIVYLVLEFCGTDSVWACYDSMIIDLHT